MDNEEVGQSIDAPIAEPEEKMVPQSQVNEIVKRRVAETAAKTRETMPEQGNVQQAQPTQSIEDLYPQFREKLAQELEENRRVEQREKDRQEMEQVAHAYNSKMALGKEKFEDFDDVIKDFDPQVFLPLVYMTSKLPNTAEVMYELQKNPQKLQQIDYWSSRDPKRAEKMLATLSDSIIENQQIKKNTVTPNSPLSKMKPSNVGTDNGSMTVADYKKAPWLRG